MVVYLIRMGKTRYFKIGIAQNTEERVKDLQTGNPEPLHVVHTLVVMRRTHAKYYEGILHEFTRENETQAKNEWRKLNTGALKATTARMSELQTSYYMNRMKPA